MKVLMLGWELPPHNSGGLGVACHQICAALSKHNIDIEFMLPYHEQHDAPFMKITAVHPQGAKVVLSGGSAYDSYKYVYEDGSEEYVDIYGQQRVFEHAVARMVEDREFDIIHAHDWLTFRAGLRAKQIKNVPLVLHVHSVERDRAGGQDGNPLVREIEEVCMQMADQIIAVSQLTKDAIIKDYGIPADKIAVVHNSVDHSIFTPVGGANVYAYLSAMKAHGYKVIVNVGRLTVQKGLANFLQAARLVVEREPKTLFLIVGSGEQYFELITQAANLGIARNVLFAGFQRGKAWRDAFSVADLFVMPSVSEPFGIAPLEAIGFGTPVMISKQSGVSEVLYHCLKVDFWDIDEMANQMTAVVQNRPLRDELHRNSTRELYAMTWAHAAQKLIGLYKQHTETGVAA